MWFYRSETQLLLLTMGCALFLFHKQRQWFPVPWSQALTYFKNVSCYHVGSFWVLSSFAFLRFWFYLQGENCILGVLSTSIFCPLCLSVQFIRSLSHVWLFVTPWTAARQASLSITNSRSLLKLMSIESVMPSNHLILCDLYVYTVDRIKMWSFPWGCIILR